MSFGVSKGLHRVWPQDKKSGRMPSDTASERRRSDEQLQAAGTIGRTLVAFSGIVDVSDILKTGILACEGAIVSFGVSKGLHRVWPQDKKSGRMPGDTASERGRSDEQRQDWYLVW